MGGGGIIGKLITTSIPGTSKEEIKKILFDINLKPLKKGIYIEGEKLNVQVSLINLGVPGRVHTNLSYQIKNSEGDIIYEENETIQVETQIEFIKNFNNLELKSGKYTLSVDLKYVGQTEPAQAAYTFSIVKEDSIIYFAIKNRNLILVGLSIIIILIILAISSIKSIKKLFRRSKKSKKYKSTFLNRLLYPKRDPSRLKNIKGLKVYTEEGDKIGKIKEARLKGHRIDGWIINLDKKIAKKVNKKSIFIKQQNIRCAKDVIFIDQRVLEYLKKFK